MKKNLMKETFGVVKPVFGMIHMGAMPGAPRYKDNLQAVLDRAVSDAEALNRAGVDALVIENFNDDPFFKNTNEPETVATMTLAGKMIKDAVSLPLGINILRNSWKSSLAVCHILDGLFIRLNITTDAMVTDQGIIETEMAEAMRYRKNIGAEKVLIFSDIESKHAVPLAPRPRKWVAQDMAERGAVDGIIVSGQSSSDPVNVDHIKEIKEAVPETPVIIGSGMSIKTVDFLKYADATIFGFGAKKYLKDPVDPDMAMAFMDAVRKIRES